MAPSTYALRLPGPLLEKARWAAEASGSSLHHFLLAAIAEKVGGGGTLAERAARADPARARAVLDRVPDVPPEAGDER
jgi:hypothetical protein